MFRKRVLPKKAEDSKNNTDNKTRARKQHGPIQIPRNQSPKYGRYDTRGTPYQ